MHRALEAKLDIFDIPKSNIPGVVFNRYRKRWEVRIKEDEHWKYVGSFKELEMAIVFQKEVLG